MKELKVVIKSSPSSWCGYIDVLGTRALAVRSAHELHEMLDKFHTTLQENHETLSDGNIVAFSDGAFLTVSDIKKFIEFYRRVRNTLFSQEIFFSCAIIPGSMEIIDSETNDIGSYIARRPPKFRSYLFSGKGPDAYKAQTELKGAGCAIHDVDTSLPDVVQSFFVRPEKHGIRYQHFYDVKFRPYELSDAKQEASANPTYLGERRLFDEIIRSCHIALSQSNIAGAYYLATIVTAVRSTKCDEISYKDGELVGVPFVIQRLLMSRSAMSSIRDMPGVHSIYLCIYDHLFNSFDGGIPRDVEAAFVSRFSKIRQCFRNLDSIPNYVISPKAKRRLIETKAQLDSSVSRR